MLGAACATPSHPPVTPTVIGYGRIGRALSAALSRVCAPSPVVVVRRGEAVAADTQGPLWVCTTNDALPDLLPRLPAARRRDLILTQNGQLLPVMHAHALLPPLEQQQQQQQWQRQQQHGEQGPPASSCGHDPTVPAHGDAAAAGGPPWCEVTQVLLYMSADERGVIRDGGGLSAVSGPCSHHVAAVLGAAGVRCRVLGGAELQAAAVEKSLWAATQWALSAGLGVAPVGHIAEHHAPDVEALTLELLPLAADHLRRLGTQMQALAAPQQQKAHQQQQQQQQQQTRLQQAPHPQLVLPPMPAAAAAAAAATYLGAAALLSGSAAERRVVEGQLAYSRAIAGAVPSRAMALAEFEWRNGSFLRQAHTPLHRDWLKRAGVTEALIAAHPPH